MLVGLFTACTPISTEAEISCRSAINAISTLTHNLRVPEHLRHENAQKTGTEFDVNEYFSVLKHLSMPSGYPLDYFYYYGGIGGEPILYARPTDQPPYQSLADYEQANGKFFLQDTPRKFIESVRTDETEAGFLQLIALQVMGNQFYQYWHAGRGNAGWEQMNR